MKTDLNNISETSDEWSDIDDSELLLLDNAAEVVQSITPIKKSKKVSTNSQRKGIAKKQTILKKTEIEAVLKHLTQLKGSILQTAEGRVIEKRLWDSFQNYREILNTFSLKTEFQEILSKIFEDYLTPYSENNKGRNKYDEFQLAWFQNISKYLFKVGDTDESKSQVMELYNLCSHLCTDTKQFLSSLIASMHTEISAACSKQIISYLEDRDKQSSNRMETTPNSSCTPDEDHHLYKIHGWILYEMKKHLDKANCTLKEQERVAWEACVKSVTCTKEEKANMPSQLHHLDKGLKEGMTFPRTSLLPFMRMCDLCFREFSSEENFLKFGKSLPNVIKLQMSSHSELKEVFIENIQAMCTDISCSLCDQVHSFWMGKFCNVRIKDYMDAKERLNISKSDKITTRTQNLRDGLLTNHVASSSNK